MSNKSEELAKASKELMLKEPFYGLFLIMLNKQWSTKIRTAGVSLLGVNYQLYLNEKFWGILNSFQQMGLLKHELLHIGFFHITDFDHLTNHDIANIAMDLEINQYIDKDWLPPGPQLLECYPELNLLPKQGTKYYYDKLLQGAQQNSCPNLTKMLAAMAAAKGQGQGDPSDGAGGDGNGHGEVELDINGQPKRVRMPGHDSWEEFEGLDEATKKLVKTQTATILKEVAEQVSKSRGTVPSEFEEILKRITALEPPRFNWKGYLRRFIGGSVKSFIKTSKHKPNFRFPDTPGIKNKPRRHILVALDTSGSVSTKELIEFIEEIHHMSRTGTEVTFIECDAAISYKGKFDPKKDFIIHGRGGTSFHPVTEYYDKNYKKYNCLIYLTDGCAPAPPRCRGPVLWAISTKGQRNEDLKGLQIQLN